jgi:hypothetical protein
LLDSFTAVQLARASLPCGGDAVKLVDPKAHAKYWIDDQTLDRIVAAPGNAPDQLDRDLLRSELLGCYERYSRATSPAAFKRNTERLIGIRKYTGKLVTRMAEDDADLGIIRPISATLMPQLLSLIELLDEGQLQTKPKDFADRTKSRLGITGSALQALTGLWLPKTYEKHFRRAAGSSRHPGGGPPDGPYIRFAASVLAAWKIEGSAETIDAALGQHGKSRKEIS